MANLPPSLNLKAAPFEASSSISAVNKDRRIQSAEQLVLDLYNPDLRENALLDLSKKRELFQDLAPLLWNSFGTVAALLQQAEPAIMATTGTDTIPVNFSTLDVSLRSSGSSLPALPSKSTPHSFHGALDI